jgi:uncharacterized cupin superfamily protein
MPSRARRERGGPVPARPRGCAHQLSNRTEQPARFVITAYHGTPEIIEYVDDGIVIVGSRTPGHDGERVFSRFRSADALSSDDDAT